MIPAFAPFLALRYLLARRINLLGIGGVMFAVWAMLVVDGVFTGFVREIRTDVRRSTPDLLVTNLPADQSFAALEPALQEAAAEVVAYAPRLRHHGLLQPLRQPRVQRALASSEVDFNPMEGGFALLLGIDPDREAAVTGLVDWLQRAPATLQAHGVAWRGSDVLGEPDPLRRRDLLLPDEVEWQARRRAGLDRPATAAEHRSAWPGVLLGWRRLPYARWLEPGDPLDLLCAAFLPGADGRPEVKARQVRVAFAGLFATGHRMFDETTVLLPIETLRSRLGHDLADPRSVDLCTDIAVRTAPGLSAAQLAALQTRLAAAVQARLPQGSPPVQVYDWQQQNAVFLSAVAHEQAMMQVVLFVVMLVAAFVIYATLHMMVVQKWKDIGILAAIGGAPRGIGLLFLCCGAVVGGLGALLGALLGTTSLRHLNDANGWLYRTFGVELFPRALFDLQQVPTHLAPSWAALVAIAAFLLALLVAAVPSRKAARLNPVQALAYE